VRRTLDAMTPAELAETRRILAALAAAIEAGDLQAYHITHGGLVGAIVICDTLLARDHTENGHLL
jgi:DNA-binding GntR family transcriptional regulator